MDELERWEAKFLGELQQIWALSGGFQHDASNKLVLAPDAVRDAAHVAVAACGVDFSSFPPLKFGSAEVRRLPSDAAYLGQLGNIRSDWPQLRVRGGSFVRCIPPATEIAAFNSTALLLCGSGRLHALLRISTAAEFGMRTSAWGSTGEHWSSTGIQLCLDAIPVSMGTCRGVLCRCGAAPITLAWQHMDMSYLAWALGEPTRGTCKVLTYRKGHTWFRWCLLPVAGPAACCRLGRAWVTCCRVAAEGEHIARPRGGSLHEWVYYRLWAWGGMLHWGAHAMGVGSFQGVIACVRGQGGHAASKMRRGWLKKGRAWCAADVSKSCSPCKLICFC